MLDHIGIQVSDVGSSLAFYLQTFGPIGMREVMRFPAGDSFVVGVSGPTESRRSGSAQPPVLHAPREWPEYHPGYYGVFLRDLDGHNVEAVYHGQ